MATPAAEVDADGQAVRVSSPDRVIYPATDPRPRSPSSRSRSTTSPSATASCARWATGPRRWSAGPPACTRASSWRPVAATRATRSTASGCPRAPRRTSRRRGSPSRAGAPPTRSASPNLATVAWCAQMGTITFHPWPTRSGDNDHPDELRIDLDPQPGTTFTDAVRVAGVARELLEELGHHRLPEDERQPRRARLRADRAALGLRRRAARRDRVRSRAGEARRGRHHQVVEGGARRAHLRRLQPELPRPHHRLGVLPAPAARRPGLHAR